MASVAFTNLGCRVNRVEIDAIARELTAAGFAIVPEAEADVIVINTCAVTAEAEAKARKAVRHAAALVQAPWVVATGCVASLFADELSQLGERVVVEPIKKNVADRVMQVTADACGTSLAKAFEDPRPTSFTTPTGRMRPGIKIQDGCDNRCTYCIVWKARGKASSSPVVEVIGGINKLVAEGAREVVLTGIDLGRYDADGLDLTGLCKRILAETEVGRVRISSVEPAGVTPELLDLMATSKGRIAPFLHIPLQSGCDDTLKRMKRPYTVAEYCQVVDTARAAVDDIALACDLIVAFPGETDEEFQENLATCKDIGFANMHVFRYSKRPGTPAATMPDQVPPEVSAARSKEMRTVALESRRSYVNSLVGKPQLVLVEQKGLGTTGGLVEAAVDDGLVGQLLSLTPHGLTREGLLDMRSDAQAIVHESASAPSGVE